MRYFGLENLAGNVDFAGKRVLILHQKVAAKALAELAAKAGAASVRTASWFMDAPEIELPQHQQLKEEDDLITLADNDHFDLIAGDSYFKRALPHFSGEYLDFPHFAVSGRLV